MVRPNGSSGEGSGGDDLRQPATEANGQVSHLRDTVERDYVTLVRRLSATLRSHDDAVAALHDAYVRLANAPAVGEVRQPFAYLYRMALNLARNSFKREAIYSDIDQDRLTEVPDDRPDPERTVLEKIDASKILAMLSDRRREIFLARWRDELGHAEIAAQFGLHKRTVQKELARAERLLKQRLDSA